LESYYCILRLNASGRLFKFFLVYCIITLFFDGIWFVRWLRTEVFWVANFRSISWFTQTQLNYDFSIGLIPAMDDCCQGIWGWKQYWILTKVEIGPYTLLHDTKLLYKSWIQGRKPFWPHNI
jgi:hypothetical protein